MNSKDVFVGTIKKCKNIYCYENYGEERFVTDFIVGHAKLGETHKYVDVIYENAILIKVSESKYIWVDLLTNKFEELLVNLGISINTIGTVPSYDGDLFVDQKTIQPLFDVNKGNLSIKKAKTLVKSMNNVTNKSI